MYTIVQPRADWHKTTDPNLIFPELHYRQRPWSKEELRGLIPESVYANASDERAFDVFHAKSDRCFIVGGSWNAWVDRPLYMQRRDIFENSYFPYDHKFRYFEVRYAALLWPRLNACAYSSLRNPDIVFLAKTMFGKDIFARFEFLKNKIHFTEYV